MHPTHPAKRSGIRRLPLVLAALASLAGALAVLALTAGGPARAQAPRHHETHTAAASGPVSARDLALREGMRKLWEDHITWTRLVIVGFAGDLPGLSASEVRLLRNQRDLGDAVAAYYGRAAGNQLTRLLREHILIAVDVLAAAKAGRTAALESAQRRWSANGERIAAFLHGANPSAWPLGEMRGMMAAHLGLTAKEATDQLGGHYAASVRAYDAVHAQILEMADMLSEGIVRQFPDRFGPRPSA